MIFYIILGGMIGAICRLGLNDLFYSNKISTWIANLVGSLLLVYLFLLNNHGLISQLTYSFWGVGFSGAFTTFATVNNQLFETLLKKQYREAFILSVSTYLVILTTTILFYCFLNFIYFNSTFLK